VEHPPFSYTNLAQRQPFLDNLVRLYLQNLATGEDYTIAIKRVRFMVCYWD
jgi:hypothetical protein